MEQSKTNIGIDKLQLLHAMPKIYFTIQKNGLVGQQFHDIHFVWARLYATKQKLLSDFVN